MARPGLGKVFHFAPKEGLTPTKLFNGDLGLVTVDNHRKSVFNTYKLFNRLQPTLLSTNLSGPGTDTRRVGAITTKDPASKAVTVVMWNYQDSPTDVSINIGNLPYAADGKNVRVTQYVIDGQEPSEAPNHGWSSQWGRTDNHPESVRLTLPSARTPSRIDLFPRTDPGNEGKGFPIDFTVRVATDANCTAWTTVVARGGYWNPGRFRQTFGFSPRSTRCVEVQATRLYRFADSGFHLFQLGEIKLHA
ncbi:hypothetical protein OG394_12555 [Kribbella sp. NBC_01245]|uniref:hypothetical protein n=1 Tax=Kribbella sp. NBC_01245 TaxID=2903578 RepID=UPI002E2886BE|nr:hypothetical protein [Kribbella sp. NBC_01245]